MSATLGGIVASGGSAHAAAISPDLQAALRGKSPSEPVAVIITLSDRVRLGQFATKDRRSAGTALIRALQDKAAQTQAPVASVLQSQGATRVRSLWAVNALAAKVPASAISVLEAIPAIESIRLDAVVQAPVTTLGIPGPEWNIAALRAADVWALGYDGTGVVVANMDTGVDPDHPDLAARWRGGANSWFDPNGEHAIPYDRLGHGTQTMGIMAGGSAGGTAIGVAPGARWIAVKIFNDVGQATLSGIHLGFQWLLDPDGDPTTADAPDVVNNSWGLQGGNQCVLEFNTDIQVLKTAGIGVVFAGGNSGPNPLTSESPANNPEGFAVGAVDSASNVAGFSSRGPSACDGTVFPELAAPGVNVRTSDLSFGGMPLYATVSGTSFAAPHVAGAMALLVQAFPGARVSALESALTQGARDLGSAGPDNSYGYGMGDVLAAYNLLAGQAASNRAPNAGSDAYSTQAGSALNVAAPGVLGNDSDPDGDPLAAVLMSGPTGGALSLNPDGSFVYTPNPGTTADSFSYQASDGKLSSNTATVSISVVAANKPPVAKNDSASTRRNTAVVINLVANDRDPDGTVDPTSIVLVTAPKKSGGVMVNADGTVTYTPRVNFTGTDGFSYTVRDNLGAVSNKAGVSVSVKR